ncbi:hypothetical protein Glove_390g49 [Diversispora epigaea]|uniref:Uncharacterized protein n=1 Tax=Diversispora epigaea TaxID=1348612 RepID=A0A397H6P5_9GLOM|nr:hypothetical protein Glove_390g49 [Diversispora epigaea]
MIGEYTCPFYHNSGDVYGKTCIRPEGYSYHWKAKRRVSCTDCGKHTGSTSGRCCYRRELPRSKYTKHITIITINPPQEKLLFSVFVRGQNVKNGKGQLRTSRQFVLKLIHMKTIFTEKTPSSPFTPSVKRTRAKTPDYYVTQYYNRLQSNTQKRPYDEIINTIKVMLANTQEKTYEEIIDTYRDMLTILNITLCKECFHPISIEKGEYCDNCLPE